MSRKQLSQQPVYSVKGLNLKKYEREGVDISLLIATLGNTPTERLENNLEFLKFMNEAEKSRLARQKSH